VYDSIISNSQPSERFDSLSLESKNQALVRLGLLPCAASGFLDDDAAKERRGVCSICDRHDGQTPGPSVTTWDQAIPDDYKELTRVLSSLLGSTDFRRSKKARVLAAHAIRRIINHTADQELLLVGSGVFGPWLMRSLQSSVRELRVASA
jgi:serine/threonine-protein kinase ATR